jgi:chloride channel protein, CIC family
MQPNAFITFVRRLFHVRRIGRNFENPRYLLKWLFISTLIGIVAGIGAIAFFEAIYFANDLLLGKLVGYLPPDPAGEGKTFVMPLWSAARPWLLPLVTAGGGLLAGIIVIRGLIHRLTGSRCHSRCSQYCR